MNFKSLTSRFSANWKVYYHNGLQNLSVALEPPNIQNTPHTTFFRANRTTVYIQNECTTTNNAMHI